MFRFSNLGEESYLNTVKRHRVVTTDMVVTFGDWTLTEASLRQTLIGAKRYAYQPTPPNEIKGLKTTDGGKVVLQFGKKPDNYLNKD
ncbi:hypothetical protein BgiBS90_021602 [Biomphalaria glabrata]|nr:hypothetical protein BgiBS90_021602 [Biomphalaria glabrata]